MSRLSKLHQNPKHKEAEHTLFMRRLCYKIDGDAPTKMDCINLMQQYRHLYHAMEKRAADFINYEPLRFFNRPPWLARSALLSLDMTEMTSYLSANERNALDDGEYLYPAMQAMLSTIEHCSATELFAFFAVRGLGDVFGGQHLQRYNQKVFKNDPLSGHFYTSVSSEARSIAALVNEKSLFDNDSSAEFLFFDTVDAIFQQHVRMFEAMEQARSEFTVTNPYRQALKYVFWGASATLVVGASAYAIYHESAAP